MGQGSSSQVTLQAGALHSLMVWSQGWRRGERSYVVPGCDLSMPSDTLLATVTHLGVLGRTVRGTVVPEPSPFPFSTWYGAGGGHVR